MSLQNLQLDMVETLLDGETPPALPVRPLQNLMIYQHAIQHLLIATLKKTYPLIVKLVGSDFFQITAKEYIKHYPSRSPNVNDYGAYFSDFLAEFEPLHDLIYLVEVAQFEWICHTLSSATNHQGIRTFQLDNITVDQYDQLHFTLHPACHLQRFYYPILRIIELCKSDKNESLDVDAGGINLLIARHDMDLTLIPLTHAEFTFLDMIAEGKSVGESLNTAMMLDREFNISAKIPEWIESKILVECYLTP
jgi:hypothetical protein